VKTNASRKEQREQKEETKKGTHSKKRKLKAVFVCFSLSVTFFTLGPRLFYSANKNSRANHQMAS
jgi:hypothetical protein